jgi:nicotinamidase-related amidase
MLRRDTIIIGGAATHRGVETSVREAFNVRTVFALPRACARECKNWFIPP